MCSKSPTDFISHPIANSWTGILIKKESFEGFIWVSADESFEVSKREGRIMGLGRQVFPRFERVMEHRSPKHSIVIKDQGSRRCLDDQVIMLLRKMIDGGLREFSRHSEMDF